jgi:hypothetical protein
VAAAVLALHLAWLLFVIFGALWTRGRPVLTAIHVASLVWGIAVEVGPWPCPLTELEQRYRPYDEPFLVHYLERIVYPDIPVSALVAAAVAVCGFNLGVYVRRWRRHSL